MKYVYIRYGPIGKRKPAWFYIVGFYAPGGKFHAENEFTKKIDAVERVHYLNGGKNE